MLLKPCLVSSLHRSLSRQPRALIRRTANSNRRRKTNSSSGGLTWVIDNILVKTPASLGIFFLKTSFFRKLSFETP